MTPREASHTCHAIGCTSWCHPSKLMCAMHWGLVNAYIRRQVYAHFNPAQCTDDEDRPLPTRAWHHAADKAIAWVAWREGKWTTDQAEKYVARHD